jgi:hypothetical protein
VTIILLTCKTARNNRVVYSSLTAASGLGVLAATAVSSATGVSAFFGGVSASSPKNLEMTFRVNSKSSCLDEAPLREETNATRGWTGAKAAVKAGTARRTAMESFMVRCVGRSTKRSRRWDER